MKNSIALADKDPIQPCRRRWCEKLLLLTPQRQLSIPVFVFKLTDCGPKSSLQINPIRALIFAHMAEKPDFTLFHLFHL